MRRPKHGDNLRKYAKRNYDNYPVSLSFKDSQEVLTFNKGITGITGLNGSGKSSVLMMMRKALGMKLSLSEEKRIEDIEFKLTIKAGDQTKSYPDEEVLNDFDVIYLDSEFVSISKRAFTQTFLDDYKDGVEPYEFSTEEIADLNFLLGKGYSSVCWYEFDLTSTDIPDYETETILYFEVKENGEVYDSRTMGDGELFLLWIYSRVKECGNNTLILIDELDSFISVRSQRTLMMKIVEYSLLRGANFIVTSQSPFTTYMLNDASLRMIVNSNSGLMFMNSTSISKVLETLGMEINTKRVLYVEDKNGEHLLRNLLTHLGYHIKEYEIVVANSESSLQKIAKFHSLNFNKGRFSESLAVFDFDQVENIERNPSINKGFIHLPFDVEEYLTLVIKDFKEEFREILDLDMKILELELSKIAGLEKHDVFLDLCTNLRISHFNLVRCLFTHWESKEENKAKLQEFRNELEFKER